MIGLAWEKPNCPLVFIPPKDGADSKYLQDNLNVPQELMTENQYWIAFWPRMFILVGAGIAMIATGITYCSVHTNNTNISLAQLKVTEAKYQADRAMFEAMKKSEKP